MKKVILCVDDEKMILNSIKTQLKENFGSNYLYETAENAFDALELIDELVQEEAVILIIVSDWLMPGIKGDEFLIKVHEKYPQIIKVMLTGQADPKAIERAVIYANLYKCLLKPWEEKELINTIKTGLETV
jgi:DNA-binding NtrC family response regulator